MFFKRNVLFYIYWKKKKKKVEHVLSGVYIYILIYSLPPSKKDAI